MKKSKKINREHLKSIIGGEANTCYEYCPPGPYGPEGPLSCAAFHSLPECCKGRVLVSYECFDPYQ